MSKSLSNQSFQSSPGGGTSADHAVVILDRTDPRAVLNLVPESFIPAIEQLAFENPELLNKDERTLKTLIKEAREAGRLRPGECSVGATENRLRVAFWNEYNRAQDTGGKLSLPRICAGVCTAEYFTQEILNRKGKLAWVLTPPVSYTNAMEEALVYGVEKLRDILDVDLKDAKGQVNIKAAEVFLKTIQFLDARVKGAVVQRVDLRSLSLSGKLDQPKNSEPLTLTAVQDQLAKLEEKARAMLESKNGPIPEPIEVVAEQ